MRPLIIDNATQEAISLLVRYALLNPLTGEDLKEHIARSQAVGENPNRRLQIPVGFRLVFSIEQFLTVGWCRHLSVSINEAGRFPAPAAVDCLMQELGFTGGIVDADYVGIESNRAINVIESDPGLETLIREAQGGLR